MSLSNVPAFLSLSTAGASNAMSAVTASGYSLLFWAGGNPFTNHVQVWIDVDGPNKGRGILGKDVFGMIIYLGDLTNTKKIIPPGSSDRTQLKTDATSGCSKSVATSQAGTYCGKLIMVDGWKIADDYPW